MGYCAYKIKKKDINPIKNVISKSRRYKLVSSNIEGNKQNKPYIWFEGNLLWMHNSYQDIISNYLYKKGFNYT